MKAQPLLSFLLVLALAGCATLGFLLSKEKQEHAGAIERLELQHQVALEQKEEEAVARLAEQTAKHEVKLQALSEDFDQRLDELRGQQREQMAAAYEEFESIFEGNQQTLEYINLLEGKVRAGQQLSRNEVEKLTNITAGLGYLQKQYQRPMQEFSELEAYFERKSAAASAPAEAPKKSFGFFRRMFSKNYREAEREFYREEGERRAFEEAQGEFSRVYASAQQSMQAVNLNADAQIEKLYLLIEEKDTANAQDLTDFFNKARQALKTHQDVLQFDPQDDLPEVPAP